MAAMVGNLPLITPAGGFMASMSTSSVGTSTSVATSTSSGSAGGRGRGHGRGNNAGGHGSHSNGKGARGDKPERPAQNRSANGRIWTTEQDELLREGVLRNGAGLSQPTCWQTVMANIGPYDFTGEDCRLRWDEIRDLPVKGPWSVEEDALLQELVDKFGPRPKKWSLIASHIPGRAGKQCRERWLNHLDTSVKKGEWTEGEDRVLCDAQRQLGNKWSEIAKLLPGRAENSVKNRFNSLITRRVPRPLPTHTHTHAHTHAHTHTRTPSSSSASSPASAGSTHTHTHTSVSNTHTHTLDAHNNVSLLMPGATALYPAIQKGPRGAQKKLTNLRTRKGTESGNVAIKPAAHTHTHTDTHTPPQTHTPPPRTHTQLQSNVGEEGVCADTHAHTHTHKRVNVNTPDNTRAPRAQKDHVELLPAPAISRPTLPNIKPSIFSEAEVQALLQQLTSSCNPFPFPPFPSSATRGTSTSGFPLPPPSGTSSVLGMLGAAAPSSFPSPPSAAGGPGLPGFSPYVTSSVRAPFTPQGRRTVLPAARDMDFGGMSVGVLPPEPVGSLKAHDTTSQTFGLTAGSLDDLLDFPQDLFKRSLHTLSMSSDDWNLMEPFLGDDVLASSIGLAALTRASDPCADAGSVMAQASSPMFHGFSQSDSDHRLPQIPCTDVRSLLARHTAFPFDTPMCHVSPRHTHSHTHTPVCAVPSSLMSSDGSHSLAAKRARDPIVGVDDMSMGDVLELLSEDVSAALKRARF